MKLYMGIIFWFCANLLIFFGTVLIHYIYSNAELFDNADFSFDLLLLVFTCSVVIMSIATLGCCGALRENYKLIITFGLLLLLLFILGFIGALSLYYNRTKLDEFLEDRFDATIQLYPLSPRLQRDWNDFQLENKCCGVNSPADWRTIGNGTIPTSCCEKINNCTIITAYSIGCKTYVSQLLEKILRITVIILGILIFFQIIFIGIACRAYRKQRQNLIDSQEYINPINEAYTTPNTHRDPATQPLLSGNAFQSRQYH